MSRPATRGTLSSVSERVPLSAVPTIMLPETGETILMGRSSASCHHQLSANRLISRVHVEATYKPAPNPFDRASIEIKCTGWNGIKLHCQGKTYDLAKDKTFKSDIKDADVMIDVHDARVLVQWPRPERKESGSVNPDHTWDENSPRMAVHERRPFQGSPLRERQRLVSPVSPTPAVQALIPPSSPLLTPSRSHNPVVVYEDAQSPIRENSREDTRTASQTSPAASESVNGVLQSSQSSDLSDLSKSQEDFSDHDEENDPIIHSFGPFGENILPRMASFRAGGSPPLPRSPGPLFEPRKQDESTPEPLAPKSEGQKSEQPEDDEHRATIRNHTVNQLAFSRLSSTPFSTILNNLPPGVWKRDGSGDKVASKAEIRAILDSTKCIGKVQREGKDAAGKPLESEYYYIPDFDEDDMRREAVVHDLRKPGLRNCRKQHKVRCTLFQYFLFC